MHPILAAGGDPDSRHPVSRSIAGGLAVASHAAPPPGKVSRVGFVSPQSAFHRPARRQCILGSHARDGLRRRPESHCRIPLGGGSLRSSSCAHWPKCCSKRSTFWSPSPPQGRSLPRMHRARCPSSVSGWPTQCAPDVVEQPGPAGRESDRTVDGLGRRHGRQVAGTAAGSGSPAFYVGRGCESGQPVGARSRKRSRGHRADARIEAAVDRSAGNRRTSIVPSRRQRERRRRFSCSLIP